MDDGTPKRRWWRKKRWIAAAGVPALLIAYPASLGVVAYSVGRGIVSENTEVVLAETVYLPLASTVHAADGVPQLNGLAEWFDDRCFDLQDLGDRHRDDSFVASPVPADVPFADEKKFVGIDFDFNVQDTVRPAAATE